MKDIVRRKSQFSRRSFIVGSMAAAGGIATAAGGAQTVGMAQGASVAPPPPGSRFDVIIIGGGTIGLSAAYYAAKRDLKTLLLEQHDQFADAHASSGGYSRMFRIMHSQPYMARLAETALTLWREIETASNATILKKESLIFYGVKGQTVEGDLGKMKRILDNLGMPYEWYDSGAALARKFSVFHSVPPHYIGLVQPNSAVIRTETSIAAFRELATNEGAKLLTGQQAAVTSIPTKGAGPYEVRCSAGNYSAPSLILAPSAWTNQVLKPFGIRLNLCIWQMSVAYFQAQVDRFKYPLWYEFGEPSRASTASPRMSRTCLDTQTTQDLFYGFPEDEKPGYIKVSADFTHNFYTDPSQCTHKPDPNILAQIGTFLQTRFNGVDTTPTSCKTCLYTMSSDYQMVLDRVPDHPNVAIFTGDSGRGFKFTPLFGRILVDLATTGSTSYDISPFAIARSGIIDTETTP